ncbi:D-aminopeptidase [Pandoraea anapnoica]|uniref:D-aminopeptidase n=1 Tax=Pandoraea anapnoica TaxID=2508301 RepID=A0A5E4ZZI9_9BURK|nr:serine hydrolase domain-containing protein [Pandoraea anapnoica]VVE66841.1 D-aminopeptidase [Pandoraea anapnoica]
MQILKDRLDELLEQAVQSGAVAGYVAGVSRGGECIALARGKANLNTGAQMRVDTRFHIGSVTKILTTHLLLNYVDAGRLDLDDLVVTHLPSFRLREPGAAERLRVRHLLNHTNGIDAECFSPMDENGPGATRDYVEKLRDFGTLFGPGEAVHYSNPGFVVAARLIERMSGKAFNRVLEDELFAPCGMTQSCTSVEQAVLHSHAVGAFPDPATGKLRATLSFMLPASLAGAGATPMSTVADMLRYGEMHLAGGRTASGQQALATEQIEAMRAVTFDMKSPNVPPVGLGWWQVPVSGVTVYWHGGTTIGTTSTFVVCPELDLVVVAGGTGPGANALHDRVLLETLAHLGYERAVPYRRTPLTRPMSDYTGDYLHYPMHLRVTNVANERLSVQADWRVMDEAMFRSLVWPATGEAFDKFNRRFAFDGGSLYEVGLTPIADGLFLPDGLNDEAMCGIHSRIGLVSFHDAEGQLSGAHTRLRFMRRAD